MKDGLGLWASWDDIQRQDFLGWVVRTCLMFGTERKTAYLVAAAFAAGLDRDLQESER